MKYTLFPLFLFLGNTTQAQSFLPLEIPVQENGQPLANPWTGGLNAPQWSAVDLNQDGKQDLYLFDRQGNVHLGLINTDNGAGNTAFQHNRHFTRHFPHAVNFVLLRDYNRDGAMDLFTSALDEGLSGFKVFKGRYNADNLLEFDRVPFPEYNYDIIPFSQNGNQIGHIEVYNQPDYPAVDDVDGDGDLDILTMNAGGDKLLFFKNIALESGFNDEVLLYELTDDCWGRFGLTPFSSELTLSTDASMCAFFTDPDDDQLRVHGGTTICTFDNDNDGDKEILYGDFIFPNMIFATNGGTPDQAWMTQQDATFPSNDVPLFIPDFPSSFHLDVNNDGARDLLMCPNFALGTPDVNTVWWYENTGTDQQPDFLFRQEDFLADGMLDFGTGANPVFADVNADGLLDLVIGNRMEWDSVVDRSYLVLLLNTGTAESPAFEVTDRDWLGLSAFNPDLRSLSPAFGDLDSDGDQDLLIGDRQGFLHFFENTAGPGQPMQFPNPIFVWKNINVGAYSTPFLHDLNNDGLLDLLVGERAGNINYLPNTGTPTLPDFHPNEDEAPNNPFLGKITTIIPNVTSTGFSQPAVLAFPEKTYLVTGTEAGWFQRYEINPDSLQSGSFEIVDDKWAGFREGHISRLALANINDDEFLEAVTGNDRGGISIFRSPITVDGIVSAKEKHDLAEAILSIFPNPAFGTVQIGGLLPNTEAVSFQLFDTLGKLRSEGLYVPGQDIPIALLANGVYFLKINSKGKTAVLRFVKQ